MLDCGDTAQYTSRRTKRNVYVPGTKDLSLHGFTGCEYKKH